MQRVGEHSWAFIAEDERSSNGALFVGDDAALAVDPGLTPEIARRFFAAIRLVTDRPVRTVALTHWHPDHALGAVCLQERSWRLVSTAAARDELAERFEEVRDAVAGSEPDPALRDDLLHCVAHLPDHLIEHEETFDLGGHTVRVFAPGVGHTTGDLVVWSETDHVLATGDLFLNRSCPDMEEGSVAGLLRDLDQLLALHAARVIPGHFGVATQRELSRFRDYIQAVDEFARAALARGLAPAQTGEDARFPAFDDYRQFPQYKATFADNVRAAARQRAAR